MSDDATKDELAHLRKLILGSVETRIEHLETEFEHNQVRPENVSLILADAVKRSTARDEKLGQALGPTLSEAFKKSVRRDPKSLADAIAPIMGPAIRRSIQDTLRAMVQSLNSAVEHSLSPQGLRWRVEAWRTGKSYGEVALLHTLVYRTEYVWLVDQETGLLMQSVSIEPEEDVALMSSMLGAIQDFGRDSFGSNELLTMRFADLIVWVFHGPQAYLAAAFRGSPPISLRERLQAAVERVHVDYADLLHDFDGDTAPMELVREDLEELMDEEFVNKRLERSAPTGWARYARIGIPVTLVTFCCVWFLMQWWHQRYLRDVARILDLPATTELSISDDVVWLSGSAYSDEIRRAENRLHRFQRASSLDISKLEILDRAWVSLLRRIRSEPGIGGYLRRTGGRQVCFARAP